MKKPATKSHKRRKTRGSPPDPWQVQVDVYLHSETPGDFTVQSYLQSNPFNPSELVFCNNGHPGFDVTFVLHDESGQNYLFPDGSKQRDAIWSQLSNPCPSSRVWDIFVGMNVSKDGLSVTAHNKNVAPHLGQFGYTLNVTKDGGANYLALDPGGNNMNGSTGFASE